MGPGLISSHFLEAVLKIVAAYIIARASLVAQRLKHLSAMWETWVQSLGQEDLAVPAHIFSVSYQNKHKKHPH